MLTPLYIQQAIKSKNSAFTIGAECQPFANTYDSVVGAATDIANFNSLLVDSVGALTHFFYGNIAWSMWNPNAAGTTIIYAMCANDIAQTAAQKSYAAYMIRSSIILNEGWNGNQNEVLLTEIQWNPPHCVVALSGFLIPVS